MAGYDLLVIDDFGLMDLNLDKCRDLFEIIEARDCRKSTVIISLPQCQVMNSKKTSTIQRKTSFMVSAYFVFDSFSCDTFNLGCKKAGDLFGSPA